MLAEHKQAVVILEKKLTLFSSFFHFNFYDMKYIIFLLGFSTILDNIQAQDNYYIKAEFRKVTEQAFAKLSPATKQWFVTTAKQHPAGSFNAAWANEKLRQKFSIEEMNSMGGLFAAMMAYQKMINKEVRENTKIDRINKQSELSAKEDKLKLDNAKIDQQKSEASERYENAMDAATIEMVLGIVSASAPAAGSVQNQAGIVVKPTPGRPTKIDSPRLKNTQVILKDEDSKKNLGANSDESTKSSEAHKKAQQDAIKKLLDQLAELDKRVQL